MTTENDNKREISVVGQSGSRFCTNMKKKNWLFPSMKCSRGVENRGKGRLHYIGQKAIFPGNK